MIVLSGASASGKTEVAKILAAKYGLVKVITTTTRPMRVGEVDGKDYFFITKERFEELIRLDAFVEFTIYNGNYYGSLKSQVGDDKCIVTDAQGLKTYSHLNDKRVVTFFLNAEENTRLFRMLERGDSESDAYKRIKNDKHVFNPSKLVKVNYKIDSESLNLEQMADQIYNLYIKELGLEK